MPNRNRQRGDRDERAVVELLISHGQSAQRVPLSGAAGGEFSGDVRAVINGTQVSIECKVRKEGTGFGLLERWLAGHDILTVKRPRQDRLVVMTDKTFMKILGGSDVELRDGTDGGSQGTDVQI